MASISKTPLKIVHVVTLVSPDGAYGGPVRVAQNQAEALSLLGHDVEVFAGVQGDVGGSYFGAGVRSRLHKAVRVIPGIGFAGMASPSMLPALWKSIKGADVVHLHLARDMVMLPAALLCLLRRVPFVVQAHGMIDESDKKLAKVLDRLITIRTLRAGRRCFWLNPEERDSLAGLLGPHHEISLERLINGVPSTGLRAKEPSGSTEFLFLARLQKRKRPAVLVEAAALLPVQVRESIRVALVGPDEGEEPEVRRKIRSLGAAGWCRLEGPLNPSKTVERMARSSVFVLPSINEPFGMSVLEAMSVGLPAIVTDSCGLAPFIRDSGAGIVCDASVEGLAAAMRRYVEEPGLWESSSNAALALTRDEFSMEAIARQLEDVYRDVKGRHSLSAATDSAKVNH